MHFHPINIVTRSEDEDVLLCDSCSTHEDDPDLYNRITGDRQNGLQMGAEDTAERVNTPFTRRETEALFFGNEGGNIREKALAGTCATNLLRAGTFSEPYCIP
jgi:hypothetical protein